MSSEQLESSSIRLPGFNTEVKQPDYTHLDMMNRREAILRWGAGAWEVFNEGFCGSPDDENKID